MIAFVTTLVWLVVAGACAYTAHVPLWLVGLLLWAGVNAGVLIAQVVYER